MTLDLPSASLDEAISEDRKWADSLIGAKKSKPKSSKKKESNGSNGKKRKREEEDDDDVVVVTDLRPIADRLHEKLEQAAAARKRKYTDTGEPPPQKKPREKQKKHKKKEKSSSNHVGENGFTTTSTPPHKHNKLKPKEEELDDLLEEENEIIHVDDYYNELTTRVLNSTYSAKPTLNDSDYEEDIKRKILGLKKPESLMSPEFEEDLQYGTFDFSSGQPIPQYLAKTKRNTTQRLEYLIKKAERKQKQMSGTTEKAEQLKWTQLEKKVKGDKELDDPIKLKKKLKNKINKKQKSKKDWAKRTEEVKASQEKRQAKRKANIAAKVAGNKDRKINKRFGIKTKTKKKKSGSKQRRPGFEGKKQNFLNK